MQAEYAIIGGGVVGLSVAHGLLGLGRSVLVLDEGDGAIRASRGNFGLVWLQSKGLDAPHYAKWTHKSISIWRSFADGLEQEGGVDLSYRQDGGYDFHFTEQSLSEKLAAYEPLKAEFGGDYPIEVLDRARLKKEEPNIGPEVAGAILGKMDGHVNPLRLLRTLADVVRMRRGQVQTRTSVSRIHRHGTGYRIDCHDGRTFEAGRVVLCAGLGAAQLGPTLGFKAPVRPQRGQVLITEKMAPLMNRPSGLVRQVDEGGVQIGDSKEEVGLDDGVTLDVTAAIAKRAIRIYPALARAKLVRSWAALRIMSPDGLPIYQESPTNPGAFMVTCHSGITLAAAHSRLLPLWMEGAAEAPDLEKFRENRFPV